MSAEVCVRDRLVVLCGVDLTYGRRDTQDRGQKVQYGADLNNRSAEEAKMNNLEAVREPDSAFKVRIQRRNDSESDEETQSWNCHF